MLAALLAAEASFVATPSFQRPQISTLKIACHVGAGPPEVAAYAASLASKMRKTLEDAEEELEVEVVHSSKFVMRGDGLREDFARSGRARRRKLMRGAADNEQALLQAMHDAESAGLPRVYMEKAVAVLNMLSLARAEIEADFKRYEGTDE